MHIKNQTNTNSRDMCKWLYWREQIVKADVTDYQELVKTMSGIDIAFKRRFI